MGGFSRLWKLLEESGWVDMLIDSSVLSPAQMKGFVSGKGYEVCMRCYLVLSETVGRLILGQFFADKDEGVKHKKAWSAAMTVLRKEGILDGKITRQVEDRVLASPAVCQLFDLFEAYLQRVANPEDSACSGQNGAFLSVLLDAVWRVLALELSVRDDDFDAYL